MGVIAFILALNLSTMDTFAGKSKYIKEEVSSCRSISRTVKYKGLRLKKVGYLRQ